MVCIIQSDMLLLFLNKMLSASSGPSAKKNRNRRQAIVSVQQGRRHSTDWPAQSGQSQVLEEIWQELWFTVFCKQTGLNDYCLISRCCWLMQAKWCVFSISSVTFSGWHFLKHNKDTVSLILPSVALCDVQVRITKALLICNLLDLIVGLKWVLL